MNNIQEYCVRVKHSVKCYIIIINTEFMFENYLTDLPNALKYIVCKLRTVGETGASSNKIKKK